MKKRLRRALVAVAAWGRRHMHTPLEYQQQMLNAKLLGHYQYYGRPTNYRRLDQFVHAVRRIWRQWLARRTRGGAFLGYALIASLPAIPCCARASRTPGELCESCLTNPLREICTVGSVRGGVGNGPAYSDIGRAHRRLGQAH